MRPRVEDGAVRAMALCAGSDGRLALEPVERPHPDPGPGEVRLSVHACGVCRTDLHLLDGEVPVPSLPRIPGHQIVGVVDAAGPGAETEPGARVGVPWLGWADGTCRFCRAGAENLCDRARFTGVDRDGGYATACVADARFCLPLPEGFGDLEAAPLLCAGLIGFRALRLTGDPAVLGIYGFGSAAHLISQVAAWEGRRVLGFTRPGDGATQAFAREHGAAWAGGTNEAPPEELDAAIIFAPAGELVPLALRAVRKGGVVVCGGIHMSDIPSFPYADLWGERVLRSVANLTRADGAEFLDLAPRARLRTAVTAYPLDDAPTALDDLRAGRLEGSAVLVMPGH
jgi:alcohol dehydrogenase, propanol-preferring